MFDRAPPIARLSHRILTDIENAVLRFPRFHKYNAGADLRFYAMQVARCVHKAWRDPEQRQARVLELCGAVDDLKISMQLGKEVRAFGSFAEFEALAKLVHQLGQQSGIRYNSGAFYEYSVQKNTRDEQDGGREFAARSDLHFMAAHEDSLPESKRTRLSPLWRSWHHYLRTLVEVRKLLSGYGQTSARFGVGSQRDERKLRTVELPVGHEEAKRDQSAALGDGHRGRSDALGQRMGRDNRPRSRYLQHAHQGWLGLRNGRHNAPQSSRLKSRSLRPERAACTRKPKSAAPWKTDKHQYQAVSPTKSGDIILHRSGTLYDAAAWLWLHVRRCYLPAVQSTDIDHCVLDTHTGERWTFSELLAGHFMDDVLPIEALSGRADAITQDESAAIADDAWMASSLVKRRYRKLQGRP